MIPLSPRCLRWKPRSVALIVAVLCAALAVRYPLLPFESWDYRLSLSKWWDFIVDHGGFAALEYGFSNYNPPYLYAMAAASVLLAGVHKLLAIKTISIVFDFVLAFFVYKCVQLKYRESETIPILAAAAVLLAPTVVLNSAMWGQCDSIYTAFLAACLYFLLAGRPGWAFAAFGLSFSFKAQAVFLAPLLLWLLATKKLGWRWLPLSALVYLASLLPAWLLGRPPGDLLSIYLKQVGTHGRLSMNAPNLWEWISNDWYDWYPVGIAFAVAAVLAVACFVRRSRARISGELLVLLAVFSVVLTPYLLPKMHDRYFFPADVFTIVLAFCRPRYWYAPIVVGLASLCAYFSSLEIGTILPLPWAAAGLLALCAVLGWQLLRNLWPARSGDALGAESSRAFAELRTNAPGTGHPVPPRAGARR